MLLADSVTRLEQAGDVNTVRLLALVRARAQSIQVAARKPGPDAHDEEVTHQWRHDLRTPTAAIAGWVHVLVNVPTEATRLRAAEAIERNAKLLNELLQHRPR